MALLSVLFPDITVAMAVLHNIIKNTVLPVVDSDCVLIDPIVLFTQDYEKKTMALF